jgi:hypothetical protein
MSGEFAVCRRHELFALSDVFADEDDVWRVVTVCVLRFVPTTR